MPKVSVCAAIASHERALTGGSRPNLAAALRREQRRRERSRPRQLITRGLRERERDVVGRYVRAAERRSSIAAENRVPAAPHRLAIAAEVERLPSTRTTTGIERFERAIGCDRDVR